MASLTYTNYLKINELLDLQQPLSRDADGRPEHDETLFIIIHQVYELWFKQMLHEADYLIERLGGGHHHDACATLKRMLTVLKTMVAQIDILETMTPVSFNSFRARLESASGFQSYQFREFEFVLGHKREKVIAIHGENPPAIARLRERFDQSTIYDAFLRYLANAGHDVPADALARDVTQPLEASPGVQATLLHVYHNDPKCRQVCELLVDLDEGVQEWRYRHVKMVERTIGFKHGSGGSEGAAYLRNTLFRPCFADLWDIRSRL